MKIRTKLLASFIAVTVICLVVGITGYVSVVKLTTISNKRCDLQDESAGVSAVLNAHYSWRQALTESVLEGKDFTGSLDPHTCALGKWYDSDEAKMIDDPEWLAMLAKINEPHVFIHNSAKDTVALLQSGDYEGARSHLTEIILPKTQEVIDILIAMHERYLVLDEEKDLESSRLSDKVKIISIALMIIALIVSAILAIFISNMISTLLVQMARFFKKAGATGDIELSPEDEKSISKYGLYKDELGDLTNGAVSFVRLVKENALMLETVAGGDLSVECVPLSENDVLRGSLKKMSDNLNLMFGEINASSAQVYTGSKQVAEGAQSLAQGATEQAASIEELSGSIAAIAQTIKGNAEMAEKAALLSETIRSNAEKGSRQMDEMIAAVNDINTASQSISKVIKVIDDIAFQTNILALNAAVEAARAGQHGKGFAVVAEEVRNLAAKSAGAAKETGDMIQNSMEKAAMGSRIAGETAASLAEIVSGINESSELVEGIARSSEEQAQGINQINIGIDQVTQVVQQNSATAEQSAAASQEMSGQSSMLQELTSRFKLREDAAAYRSLPQGLPKRRLEPAPQEAYDFGGGDYGKY